MNGLERIAAALALKRGDRVPIIGQVFGHAAALAGVPLGDYVRNGETLAHCQLRAQARYGHDAVFALMDVAVETEAMGSRLRYAPDRYPTVVEHVLAGDGDLAALTLPDPHTDGRMPELLRAATMLRREAGQRLLVVGCVLGPMTLAVQLLGAEAALFMAVDAPDRYADLLDLCALVAMRFGLAQLEAGVHTPLVFDPAASPAMVPPALFREFELPRLACVFAAFERAGAVANWLHIAGPTASILPLYARAGVTLAQFDYGVEAATAMAALPDTCLAGNLMPLSFVNGQPDEIARRAGRLLAQFDSRGGYVLSPGCEIPPESRPENIDAMGKAARAPLETDG